MTLFGLTMLVPSLSVRLTRPLVSAGSRLSRWSERRIAAGDATTGASMLLGVATGLVWAPCAGPVLGLILTGAALQGPGIGTSLLLLAYGLGAATSLGVGVLFGRRLLALVRHTGRWDNAVRRFVGAAMVAGAATIWFGFDTGLLTRLSSARTNAFEQGLIARLNIDVDGLGADAVEYGAASASGVSGPLASLLQAEVWLNTAQPLVPADVQGKVVLVNFWTYSCINCLRTLPYIRAWDEKYADSGLVVIGVHTPEFAFEKDVANVRRASASLGVTWPVAVDNAFEIWRAFGNRGWPGFYFIDASGRVRQHVFGEGGYDRSEQVIQQLLSEADGAPMAADIVSVTGTGAQAAPDETNLRSPETYVGYGHGERLVSPGRVARDVPKVYRGGSRLRPNEWSLSGPWTVGREFATLTGGSGGITYRFHSRDLHLVLAPASPERPVRFRVRIDGAPPGGDHGFDVDADGWGSVQEDRLYQLIRQRGPISDRTFEIEFLNDGVRVYAFTFG